MWDDNDPDFQRLNFECQATPGTTMHFTMRADECLISSAPYRFENYFDLSLQDQEKLYLALGRNLACRRKQSAYHRPSNCESPGLPRCSCPPCANARAVEKISATLTDSERSRDGNNNPIEND